MTLLAGYHGCSQEDLKPEDLESTELWLTPNEDCTNEQDIVGVHQIAAHYGACVYWVEVEVDLPTLEIEEESYECVRLAHAAIYTEGYSSVHITADQVDVGGWCEGHESTCVWETDDASRISVMRTRWYG